MVGNPALPSPHNPLSGFWERSVWRGGRVKCFCLYSFPLFILRQGKQPPPYFLPKTLKQPRADSCLFYQPGFCSSALCMRQPGSLRPFQWWQAPASQALKSYQPWDCCEPLVSQRGKPCIFREGGSAPLRCRPAAWKLSSREVGVEGWWWFCSDFLKES